jgi:proline dehydrogenase
MEDSSVTQRTLEILYKAREWGFENVGIVIQAYLHRSEEDIQKLLNDCFRVRLCKGAYTEPAKVAFPKMRDIDANYDRLTSQLVDGSLAKDCPKLSPDGKIPPIPGLATHDAKRIEFAKQYINKAGLPRDAVEFQMLNGIRRDLQEQLVKEGYRVRVYVPYGTEWYPYFMRRIAERPADLLFLIPRFNFK